MTAKKKDDEYTDPRENLKATEFPEVQAAKDGKLPAEPFTPTVAVANDVLSPSVRKKVFEAKELIADAEAEAKEHYNQEAIVSLREVRRSLEGI